MTSAKKNLWVGLDLGGTKMLATIYDDAFHSLGKAKQKTLGHQGQEAGLIRMMLRRKL